MKEYESDGERDEEEENGRKKQREAHGEILFYSHTVNHCIGFDYQVVRV